MDNLKEMNLVEMSDSELYLSGGACPACEPRHFGGNRGPEMDVTWHEVKAFFSGFFFGADDDNT